MKYSMKILFTVLLLFALAGCHSMGKQAGLSYDNVINGQSGKVVTVKRGGEIISKFNGYRAPILNLHSTFVADIGGVGLEYPPASYGGCPKCLEEDEQYYYLYYPENNRLLQPNFFLSKPLISGFRVNKKDHSDIQPVAIDDLSDGIWNTDKRPDATFTHWVDLKSEYSYRKVLFKSFDDDILTLQTAQERGPSDGIGTKEEYMTYQFDLLESKRIKVGMTEFEVLKVGPEKLTVKIIKGF